MHKCNYTFLHCDLIWINQFLPQNSHQFNGKKKLHYCNTVMKIILFIHNNGCKSIYYCLPKSICIYLGGTVQFFHLQYYMYVSQSHTHKYRCTTFKYIYINIKLVFCPCVISVISPVTLLLLYFVFVSMCRSAFIWCPVWSIMASLAVIQIDCRGHLS